MGLVSATHGTGCACATDIEVQSAIAQIILFIMEWGHIEKSDRPCLHHRRRDNDRN